jgi:hypothetical protein
VFGWFAFKHRSVALSLALYITCLLPVALFGILQSRYAYISTPFLGVTIMYSASQFRTKYVSLAVCLALLVAHTIFAVQRSHLWAGAYRAAREVKTQIQEIPNTTETQLVVLNLPDSYGPPTMFWRQFRVIPFRYPTEEHPDS